MIEAFEEINLVLAAHVSKLTAADYKSRKTTHSFIPGIKGEVKYEDDVIAEALKTYNQLKEPVA
jgi:hypothetical protein